MIKRLFKGFIYFLGICTLISILAAACEDEEAAYVEHTGPNEAVLVAPEEPDSEVEVVVPEEKIEVPKEDSVPLEYKMALKSAQNYVDIMAFSEAELYDQLTSEYGGQFPDDAAQYALANVEVDYFAEAIEAAQNYVDLMAFSRQELYEQLTSEYGSQFTTEQAEYAVNQIFEE